MKPVSLVEQPIDLSAVVVRLIEPRERMRWEELMRTHHIWRLTHWWAEAYAMWRNFKASGWR